ncbi:MAG: hypothetical protein JOY66_02740 [Acetobacteraceae bacterium]|nr:hypothetical protein [Acetobacteraceae bacterium]
MAGHAKVFSQRNDVFPTPGRQGNNFSSGLAETSCARPNGPLLTARPNFGSLARGSEQGRNQGERLLPLSNTTITPKAGCRDMESVATAVAAEAPSAGTTWYLEGECHELEDPKGS